ncbi:MCE family protein [Gordonia sp. NPDC062954]|jgi:virulence factor Mce-like protein|uniref:MCE family protein n=1 Tax=unclassified Gordonia (in: high G+C Gram-positive bacteria) TaxID=2657482 RepID=UPI000C60756B|nr:MCE family protein [Gordonia sp. (in: high G+C Gram-positive bacteria)]MAU81123.1 virulence factor Mce [Gordonia sp. (in: high G+C Gram-positive bacteria)]
MRRWRNHYNENRRMWYGAIGAVVIVLLTLGVVGIAQAHLGKKTYIGEFAQAGGIRPGDKVRVAGIDVGEVSATELAGNQVDVTMKVDQDVDVTANGSAEIKMSTLLGQRYVDVSLGDSPDPLDGERITDTRVPYDLQKTIEEGTPIIAGIDDVELSESIRTLNRQLAGAPAVTKPTLDSLTEMSKVITNRRDQINQLVSDTKAVTGIVDDSQAQLSIIVGQGQQLAEKIAAREALVTRMLDGIAQLTEQARAVAAENGNQFAPIMANLNTMSQGLEKNRENLRKMLEILPVTTRVTNNTMGDGPYANGYLPWGIFPDNWLCTARVVDGC